MATLHRPRNARGKVSPFWAAMYRDASGRLVNRSTRQKVLRDAQKVAMAWESAAKKARAGELTQAASVKILRELMEATTGETLRTPSIKETFETFRVAGWIEKFWIPDSPRGQKNVKYEFVVQFDPPVHNSFRTWCSERETVG